jgi:hypothetical protein
MLGKVMPDWESLGQVRPRCFRYGNVRSGYDMLRQVKSVYARLFRLGHVSSG